MKQQLAHERNKLLNEVEQLLEGPMVFLGFVWLILLVVELIGGFQNYCNTQHLSFG